MVKAKLQFVTDTREQNPYQFTRAHRRDVSFGGSRRGTLAEGDYAVEVEGEILPVRIERKSLSDLYGVVGNGRERFERELERLQRFAAYLVIEATAEQVRRGFERSTIHGEAALGSVLHWSVWYGIYPIFAGNWRTGNRITQGILEDFAVHWTAQ